MSQSITGFTGTRLDHLRIISTSSASVSILACLVSIYLYLAIHPSRRLFRHQLIFLLIITDLFKAVAMILYPTIMMSRDRPVSDAGVQAIGWFTAFGTEGSDLAIFSFAIHTCLSIFYPQKAGGLYFLRYYVFWCCVFIPVILASLGLINGVGYVAFDVWCYLTVHPLWYRMALSWGPRYFIMLSILIIYCTIYFYVTSELRKMKKQSTKLIEPNNEHSSWIRKKLREFMGRSCLRDKSELEKAPSFASGDLVLELQVANNAKLAARYRTIAKQMKVVFLYPIAYFLLWIFPMVQSSLRIEGKTSYPLVVLVSLTQPLNGLVDGLVFMYRERPWNLIYSKTPVSAQHKPVSTWRKFLRWLPLYHISPLHLRPRQSSVDMSVNNMFSMMMDPDDFTMVDPEQVSDSTTSKGAAVGQSTEDEGDEDMDFLAFLNKGPPM